MESLEIYGNAVFGPIAIAGGADLFAALFCIILCAVIAVAIQRGFI